MGEVKFGKYYSGEPPPKPGPIENSVKTWFKNGVQRVKAFVAAHVPDISGYMKAAEPPLKKFEAPANPSRSAAKFADKPKTLLTVTKGETVEIPRGNYKHMEYMQRGLISQYIEETKPPILSEHIHRRDFKPVSDSEIILLLQDALMNPAFKTHQIDDLIKELERRLQKE